MGTCESGSIRQEVTCDNGKCSCAKGWGGSDCSKQLKLEAMAQALLNPPEVSDKLNPLSVVTFAGLTFILLAFCCGYAANLGAGQRGGAGWAALDRERLRPSGAPRVGVGRAVIYSSK